MHLSRLLTLCGFMFGAGALALQFSLSIPASMANGASLGRALVLFFSFFTILTNGALVLIYLSALTQTPQLAVFRRPQTRGLMAAVILLVMIFFHLILSPLKNWQGLWLLADTFLHYLLPTFYVVWWAVTQKHGVLRIRDLPLMLLPPLLYLPYALIVGALTGAYPYGIIDLGKLPALQVAANVFWVALGLGALMLIVIAADRLLVRARTPGPA